jgi:hypothetical protein
LGNAWGYFGFYSFISAPISISLRAYTNDIENSLA